LREALREKAVAKYSKEPAEAVDVEALLKEWMITPPKNRRVLDVNDEKIARRLAVLLAGKVDAIQEAV
jgi:hypothetical protein